MTLRLKPGKFFRWFDKLSLVCDPDYPGGPECSVCGAQIEEVPIYLWCERDGRLLEARFHMHPCFQSLIVED